MANENLNVGRILAGASSPVLDMTKLVMNSQTAGSPPIFQRGTVLEIIYNPKDLTKIDRERIRNLVVNQEEVDQAPANSVIVTVISDGVSDSTPTNVLVAPFFQSHFMLPVQIGEQVTIAFDDFQKYGWKGARWLTRAPEGLPVEDPNFTHNDRRFNQEFFQSSRTSESLNRSTGSYTTNFPNGGNESNTYTLPQNGSTNPYDRLYQQSRSGSLQHEYEIVPRWTKRPHEFVIQGMNNSLIMLGRDRVGYVTGSGINEQKSYAGAIDLVAGRSRYLLEPTDLTIPAAQSEHKKTSPFVVTNSRGLQEVDKAPRLNGRVEQTREGDPDFTHDAARIYMSMKTLGDFNFKTAKTTEGAVNNVLQPTGINYSPNSLYPFQFASSSTNVGSSYIVAKADHLRLIARRSVPAEDNLAPPISGSVLILKEGNNRTPEDLDAQAADHDHLAYLYMSPEGRVQVDGLQIFLGGAALSGTNPSQYPPPDVPRNPNGANAELTVGDQNLFVGAEPYIKWTEFKKVVEGLQRQIDALQTAYSGLVDDLGDARVNICIHGGANSAWEPLYQSSVAKRSTLSSAVSDARNKTNQAVYKSRSAKIFGS
jgi:hypothetical protein